MLSLMWCHAHANDDRFLLCVPKDRRAEAYSIPSRKIREMQRQRLAAMKDAAFLDEMDVLAGHNRKTPESAGA